MKVFFQSRNIFWVLSLFVVLALAETAQGGASLATNGLPLTPQIVTVSPSSASVGTLVAINGTHFSPVAASNIVYFGAVQSPVIVASTTNLLVAVPSGATFAPVTVTVNGLTAYALQPFLPTFNGGGQISSSSFGTRLDLATGRGPARVVIADMDGDGKPDLLISDAYAGELSIYRNIGTNGLLTTNSFAPRVVLPLIVASYSNPYTLAVADLDGDGKLDIVAINADSGLVSVIRNTSTPGNLTTNTFASRVDLSGGSNMRGVAVQDLDGDGRPEIVTANYSDNSISIFHNQSAPGTVSFASKVDFGTGAGAVAAAIADFDGDGKPDLAIAVSGGNASTVALFKNTATDGIIDSNSFATRIDLPAPNGCTAIVAADLDGDGKLDIACGAYDAGMLSVYRNISTGGPLTANSFAARVDYGAADGVHSLAVGDLNGDGRLDIAVVGEMPSIISFFQNTSTSGSFNGSSLASRLDMGTGYNAIGVSIGDLDGDGRPDVVFCNTYDNTISIYQNQIGLVPPSIVTQPASQTNHAGTAASFSVAANGSAPFSYQWYFNTNTLLANATSATLNLANVQQTNAGYYSVVIANAAGSVTSSVARLSVLIPNPLLTGLMAYYPLEDSGPNVSDVVNGNTGYPQGFVTYQQPGAVGYSFQCSSTNGAGGVICSNLYSSTNTSFSVSFWLKSDNNYSGASTVLPVNENSPGYRGWFVCNNGVNDLTFLYLTGSGYSASLTIPNCLDSTWHHVVCVKSGLVNTVYRDGVWVGSVTNTDDMVASTAPFAMAINGSNPGGEIYHGSLDEVGVWNRALSQSDVSALSVKTPFSFWVDPENTPAVPKIVSITPSSGSQGTLVTIAGSHFSPVSASNVVSFGAVQAPVIAASATNLLVAVPSGATYAPVTVTVNGLTSYSPQPFLPTFNGGGQLSGASFGTRLDLPAGRSPIQAVIADLDGDGKPDMTVANSYDNTISIYRNISTNGTLTASSFAAPVVLATLGSPYGLVVADVDGDGKPDVIVTESSDNRVSIFRNISSSGSLVAGSFAPRVDFATGATPQGLAVQDLDGDGKPDLLVANTSDGTVSILRNTGLTGTLDTNSFAARIDFATGSGCCNVVAGDLDGDGLPDVVTANTSDNTVSLLRNRSMPGSIVFAPQVLLSTPPYPINVILVDVDRDGKLDLAVAGYHSAALSVFRNTSMMGSLTTNSFAARIDFGLGGRGHTIVVGDLNGDGNPDLTVSTELSSMVSVFQNGATPGVFTNSSLVRQVDLGSGWNAWGQAVGDLDGDGRPDVVFCNAYDNTITLYQNQMPMVSAAVPAPSGLVAWWPGEGNAVDVVNGNNGSPVGALNYGSGVVGQGFVLNGSSSYVSVPASASLDVGANGTGMTIEGWVNPAISNQQGPLLEWDLGSAVGVHLWVQPPMQLYANIADVSGLGHQLFGNQNVLSGVWQHVALTYDKTTGTGLLYLNGAVIATNNFGAFTPQTSFPLNIGRRTAFNVGWNDTFNGGIDELSLYNRALSAAEITEIYGAGSAGKVFVATVPLIQSQPANQSAPAGGSASFSVTANGAAPLAYQWLFNGTNLANATNATLSLANVQAANVGNYSVVITNAYGSVTSSTAWLSVQVTSGLLNGLLAYYPLEDSGRNVSDVWNHNTGYPYGTLNYQQPGAVGYGLGCSSNGAVGGVICSNVYSSTNPSFSVSFWLNSDNNYYGGGTVLPVNENSWGYRGWFVCNSGIKDLSFLYLTGSGYSASLSISNCLDSTWHHVVCVNSGLINTVYRDGICVGSVTNTVDMQPSAEPFRLAVNGSNPGGDIYHGLLDEVGLWGRALTAAEVSELYSKVPFNQWANLVPSSMPPLVVNQPTNTTVVQGSAATFSVSVAGNSYSSYQWLFNGTNLINATNATLSLANVQAANVGNYSVVITNAYGSVTSSTAWLSVQVANGLLNGLLAYYPLEDSGPNLSDVWNHNTGYPYGTLNYQQPGVVGYGLGCSSNGAVGGVICSNVYSSTHTNFSVSFWLNSDANYPGPLQTFPVNEWSQGYGGWYTCTDGSNGLNFQYLTGNGYSSYLNIPSCLDNTWHHVVCVKSGLVLTVYRDGICFGSVTNTVDMAPSSQPFVMAVLDSNLAGCIYHGLLDEVGLWARALTPVEVSQLFAKVPFSQWASPVAPVVSNQPTNTSVLQGGTATFSVSAAGDAPLSYQWLFNSTNLLNATNTTLSLANVQLAQAGNYAVVITNGAGSVTSSVATLTVVLPPAITSQPTGQTAVCGSNVTLTVGVSGTAPLTEQWYFNGAPLNGVTGTNLTLTGVVTNNSGNYFVVVANPYGSVTSSVVTLTVTKAPAAVNLGNLLQTYDGTAKAATASTTPTNLAVVLTYNGGSTAPTNAGGYTVVGTVLDSNYLGSATNTLFVAKAAAGIVLSNLVQTYDGSPKTVTYATSPSGLVVVLTYNGQVSPPSAVGTYSVSGVVLSSNYSGVVSNHLTIAAVAPAITQQPLSQAVLSGSNATLSVTATGAPLYYQWLKNGTNVSGATASTLAFNPAVVTHAGVYSVVVSNTAGAVVSSNAVLAVRLPGAPLIHVDGQLVTGTCRKTGSAVVTMDGSFIAGTIYYTLDGTTPSLASQIYGSPLTVTHSVVVRAMGFDFADSTAEVEAPAVGINILPTYGLSLTTNGSGSILANPAGGNYVSNTVVTLTATAAPGWQFDHWTGDLTGTNNPGAVTLNGPRAVQAVFVQVAYPVTATTLGGGTVGLNPPLANYPSNTVVTATATASNGWTFLNWSGDASGSNVSVNVTVNAAKNLSAVFGTTLQTNVFGAGTIELNASNTVPYGTVVRATGIPNSGSYFAQWALALTGTNNPAEFAVNSTNVVRALFVTLPGGSVALTTRISGPGDVAVSPYKLYYTAGESVTITATPRGGTNQFAGWTGDYTGTNNPLVLVLNTSKVLTASFAPQVLTPVVNSFLSVTGLTGSAFSYQITAANNATGYAASGLPLGLSVNATNGLITGTPQSAGVYSVTLYASNGGGTAASTLVLTINSPVYAPSIVQSPSDQTVGTGTSATFSVLANGTGPLAYQWLQNGVTIPSGTNASYNIASVIAGNAGTYQVVVTNLYGSATSSVAHLTIYDAPATRVFIVATNGTSGQTVNVSLRLVCLGKENAASFSLNFDPAVLSYQGSQLGSNAQSAGLLVNTNNLGAGQLGLGLVLPAGSVFATGTQEMAVLQFALNPVSVTTLAALGFGDLPTARLVADTNANALTATFQTASFTVTPGQYCGDLYPVGNPDHLLDVRDWVRAGQLVAHLAIPGNQSDFDKIDCAPRDSDGNGVLSVADWVQVGRYAVGLDPVTVVGSQKSKKSSVVRKNVVGPKVSGTRTLTVGVTNLNAGASVSLPVVLNALGNENAVGFSISFDPAQMTLVSIGAGSGAGNASFNVNTNGAAQGQAGVALALSTGASFGAGLQPVAVLNFVAGPKAGGVTAVTLSDTVVQREVVDATAQTLSLVSANGSANINPPPFLNIVTTGSTVQLSWSLAYSNLILETLSDLSAGAWTGGLGTPTVSGTNLFLTLPLTNPHQMFRLGQ